VGQDWWRRDIGGWTLLGINDFLLDEPLPSSEAQFSWLRSVTPTLIGRKVALFTHKPLFLKTEAETTESIYCITPAGRKRLREHLDGLDINIWAAGHTHNSRLVFADGELHVWAPTLAHINYDERFPFDGDKRAGIVEYTLDGDTVSIQVVEPPGVAINDVTELFARHASFRFLPAHPATSLANSRADA
jgi:hypothetical protein